MAKTIVSFHAHPDDESLLTGGSLAALARSGHRVVLVIATDGEQGLSQPSMGNPDLGAVRRREVATAAAILGCARVVHLGYADSGLDGIGFAGSDVDSAAIRLASVLQEEQADVLTTYDRHGGYGHPDHQQVHLVGGLAAALAAVPVVLQATVDRDRLYRFVRVLAALRLLPGSFSPSVFRDAYTPAADITHQIDVRPFARVKRQALRAHASQSDGGSQARTVRVLSRLPLPLFRLVCGKEWFVETGRFPSGTRADSLV